MKEVHTNNWRLSEARRVYVTAYYSFVGVHAFAATSYYSFSLEGIQI